MRGGLSSLQPGAREPHRRLLLVGLGADLRPDRDLFRRGDPRMVSARRTGHHHIVHAGAVFRGGQSVRREMGRKTRDSDRDGIGAAGVHLRARADRRRRGGLATGVVVPPDRAVRRVVRRADRFHGGALPDRLRGAGLRGRRLPCRRNGQPQQECAARHVRQCRDGVALFHRVAGRLARRARPRAAGQGPHAGPGADVRARLRQLRQGGRHLVHDVQHVPRHLAAARGCDADDLATRRGRTAAAGAR